MRVEHDFEPVPGLPGDLPAGETVLWRGGPDWMGLARRGFMFRPIAFYFALLMAWRGGAAFNDGAGALEAAAAATSLAPVALVALGLVAGLAYVTAKATIYTITSERIVLRFGVALTMCVNVPFSVIRSASVKLDGRGRADLPLSISGRDKFSYLLLWPNARPWRFGRPEPMLRSVPDGAHVAETLASALAASQARRGVEARVEPRVAAAAGLAPAPAPAVLGAGGPAPASGLAAAPRL